MSNDEYRIRQPISLVDSVRGKSPDSGEVLSYGQMQSRRAEFAAGHQSARPDTGLSGNYSPPKEQWSAEALRTVEMERMHQLTSDKDY